jgi:serine protease Do
MPRAVLGLSFALVAAIAAALGMLAAGGGVVDPARRGVAQAALAPSPSFADVVARTNPAVVNITVLEETPRRAVQSTGAAGPRRGEGSGFIVDPGGYILTNHHVVVGGHARIRVRLSDRRELTAKLVGTDPSTDLALLKVEAEGLPAVPLGDSDRLRVGEWVCAIGNPYRFDHSVTVGVVSSKGRKIYDASFDAYIQTDAAINPGNSGGPLINAAGEAVGINSAVSVQGQGIGFAIPINAARDIMEDLRTRGHVTRGYLGVQLHEIDDDLKKLIGAPEAKGAVVLDVQQGGAGAAAGLRRYDLIMRVAGREVADGDELVRVISARPPGTLVELSVFRDRREIVLFAQLGERGAAEGDEAGDASDEGETEEGDALGLLVSDLSPEMKAELALPDDRTGVVVRDVPGWAPGSETLAHGDIIVELNRRPTPDLPAYRKVVSALKPGEVAWLYVYRPRRGSSFLAKVEIEAK